MEKILLLGLALLAVTQTDAGNKVIGQWPYSRGGKKADALTIQSQEDLGKALGKSPADAASFLKTSLKIDALDLEKQTLFLLQGGERRSGGYKVVLDGVEKKENSLVVKWHVQGPPPGAITTKVITYPALFVLVEKFQGKVEFLQAPQKSK